MCSSISSKRLSRSNNLLLDVEELLCEAALIEIEVRLAYQLCGGRHAILRCRGPVRDGEATVGILHPKLVGNLVDERLQRDPLFRHRAAGVEFSDVLMSRDPSPIGHRLMLNANCPAVFELDAPALRFGAGDNRGAPFKVILDFHRGCSARQIDTARCLAKSRQVEPARGLARRFRDSVGCTGLDAAVRRRSKRPARYCPSRFRAATAWASREAIFARNSSLYKVKCGPAAFASLEIGEPANVSTWPPVAACRTLTQQFSLSSTTRRVSPGSMRKHP